MSRLARPLFFSLLLFFTFVNLKSVWAQSDSLAPSEQIGQYAQNVQIGEASEVLQEPKGCLKSKGACAIKTSEHDKFVLSRGELTIVLDRSTALIIEASSETRLVAGTIWVKSEKQATVRSEFGAVQILAKGEMWVSRTRDRMIVSAIDGDVILHPRGGAEEILVQPGNENWIGRVARQTGQAETGVPMAIPFRPHIERWARLYSGTKADFEIELRRFHGLWSEASEQAARTHKAEFDRKIASIESEKARRLEAERKAQAQNKELRALFRQRVFDGL